MNSNDDNKGKKKKKQKKMKIKRKMKKKMKDMEKEKRREQEETQRRECEFWPRRIMRQREARGGRKYLRKPRTRLCAILKCHEGNQSDVNLLY